MDGSALRRVPGGGPGIGDAHYAASRGDQDAGGAYTDIVSVTDLLVQPPLEQSPPGTDLRVVEPRGGTVPVWHGELGRDPVSRALVLDVLGPT